MSTPFKLGVKSGNRAQSEGSAHQKSFQKSLKSEKNKNSKKLDIRDLISLYLTKLQLLGVSELFSSWCTLCFHDFQMTPLEWKVLGRALLDFAMNFRIFSVYLVSLTSSFSKTTGSYQTFRHPMIIYTSRALFSATYFLKVPQSSEIAHVKVG